MERTSTKMHRFSRRSVLRILAILATAIPLLAIYTARYYWFVRSLDGYEKARKIGFAEQAFPMLSQSQITQLGMAHRKGFQPTSSYTLVDAKKPPGVIRVGVFGCSFVKGSEAGPDQDFPSQLQRMLTKKGRQHIEVINFGVGAFGVQQSFILWDFLADQFDLDYTIYNLYGFHQQRDNTFVMLNRIYAPVHGRYIIENETLKYIGVLGRDRRDTSKRYFRLLPRWRYLRYDAKTPPQLRALLPKGGELPANPFYYARDQQQEMAEIYGRLFSEMASRSRNFFVLFNDSNSEELAQLSSHRNGFIATRGKTEKYTWDRAGFMRAPKNHPSALGYSVLAKEVQTIIEGKESFVVPEVSIGKATQAPISNELTRDLRSYSELHLTLDQVPGCMFVEDLGGKKTRAFRFDETRSIIDVSGGTEPLFIALKGRLPAGPITLKFIVDDKQVAVEIGDIVVHSESRIGTVDRTWDHVKGEGWTLRGVRQGSVISLIIKTDKRISNITLHQEEQELLKGDLSQTNEDHTHRLHWNSSEAALVKTRGHARQKAAALTRAGNGRICITGKNPDDEPEVVCTREWRINYVALETSLPPIPPLPDSRPTISATTPGSTNTAGSGR